MTMEKQPFEDVSPIKMVIVQCHVSFLGGSGHCSSQVNDELFVGGPVAM